MLKAILQAHETGKRVLVPLTSSLYVPGKLTDVENVVVDVGTGYYVKKVSWPNIHAVMSCLEKVRDG
jgi:prefoldin alpha subunit